jgi:maleylacetoacetate isomerase
MTPKLVLHSYWRSSSAYRVRIGLHAKNLAFEYRVVNLLQKDHQDPSYKQKASSGYVPCLEVDGEAFVESVAILELLDGLFPDMPLFPRAPRTRARVMELVETINSGTQPLQNLNVLLRFPESERASWAQHFIAKGLATYEALLARNAQQGKDPVAQENCEADQDASEGAAFSVGNTLTAADCFLIPQLYNADRFDVSLAEFPQIRRIKAHLENHPAVVRALPSVQPDAPTKD